jgi:hypothetical protein
MFFADEVMLLQARLQYVSVKNFRRAFPGFLKDARY